MTYKVQVAGVREDVWSENERTFATHEEARQYAIDLLMRWMGADVGRVVPVETPRGEPVSLDDPKIVVCHRRKS